MPNTLTIAQLNSVKTMIDRGDLVGFYNYMSSQGYGYANLAKGVVECSTLSGGSTAQNFMTQMAVEQGIKLTADKVVKIEIDMAMGYFSSLMAIATDLKSNGVVNRDVMYDEALKFHSAVFKNNQLDPSTWTLYLPSKYLTKEQLNANWQASIDPSISPAVSFFTGWRRDMTAVSKTTDSDLIIIRLINGSPLVSQVEKWMANVDGSAMAAGTTDALGLTQSSAACNAAVMGALIKIESQADTLSQQYTSPTVSTTRLQSSAFVTYTGSHSAVLNTSSNGIDFATLSDIVVLENAKGNRITVKDILSNNPQFANPNNIPANVQLQIPKRTGDNIIYYYTGGVVINSNTRTGEYLITAPNTTDDGGGSTLYSRELDPLTGGIIFKQKQINSSGGIVNEVVLYQGASDTSIKATSVINVEQDSSGNSVRDVWDIDVQGKVKQKTETTTSADQKIVTIKSDLDGNGTYDRAQKNILFSDQYYESDIDVGGDGTIDTRNIVGNGETYDLSVKSDLFSVERFIKELHDSESLAINSYYADLTKRISDTLLVDAFYTPPLYSTVNLSTIPIGAFYESRSIVNDVAASVANKTFVVLNAAKQKMSAAALSALDTDRNQKITGNELTGLLAFVDYNENGIADSGDVQTLAQAGLSEIRASDYAFYTQGCANIVAASLSSLAAPNVNSNYRVLRDSDNRLYTASGGYIGWIDWNASDIKINNGNRTTIIGTDNADNFWVGYYASYPQYFNSNSLVNFLGGGGDDLIEASSRADQMWGGTGNDVLWGMDGNDTLYGEEGQDVLFAGNGNDVLTGGVQADRLFGEVGDDILWGGDGDDILVGFTPSDSTKTTLSVGESDNDTLIGGSGNDLMIGGFGSDILYGGLNEDELQGGDGEDLLNGEQNNDRLFGGRGNDTIYGGDGDDLIFASLASNENMPTNAATDSNFLYGGAGADILVGGVGNDYLDGGAGIDDMEGGAGNDVYIVNSVNDTVMEQANAGYDVVISDVNYILNANIEDLRLLSGAEHGTGNSLNNLITGNSRNNILDGVTGIDTMIGAAGDDVYYVDNANDVVVELSGEGNDTVQSTISYALGDNAENLTLLDFNKAEKGLIDDKAILVYGYPKANELDYYQGDAIANFRGTCALTSISNLLTQIDRPTSEAEVVQLAIDNNWAVNSVGLPDYLLGGSNYIGQRAILDHYGIRNDLLAGYNEAGIANLIRSGRGVMLGVNAGKLWNDAGYVEDGGVNHVVTITGVAYGESDNTLMGFYIADSGRHLVSDMTRFISIDLFRQAANVNRAYAIYTIEALKLWDENINASGNSLNNTINGNRANNTLSGLVGNDTLNGESGNDTLIGGTGNDTYVFDADFGNDVIIDNDATANNIDTIRFGANITPGMVNVRRDNTHLLITVGASTVTIQNWFVSDANKIERFTFASSATVFNSTTIITLTNHAPIVASSINTQTAIEDSVFNFAIPTNAFSDVDVGDSLTYAVTKEDGSALPTWLTFNASTRTLSGTPLNNDVGNMTLKIIATDSVGASVPSNFVVTVTNTNDAPIIANIITAQRINEDAVFTFVVPANAFIDPDIGDSLRYSATLANGSALPAWLTFNAAARTLSGTPLNGDVGDITVKIIATDNANASASSNFVLTTINTNDAPTVANVIAAQNAIEDTQFSFVISANAFTDPDVGDTLRYSATLSNGATLPSWLTFNTSTRTLSGMPLNAHVGNLTIKITATDIAGASVSSNFVLTVSNTNDLPTIANVIAAQNAIEDTQFTFIVPTNTFSDQDVGDSLRYSATLADGNALPTWLTFNAATATFSGRPLHNNIGNVGVRVTATDNAGANVSTNFTLIVAPIGTILNRAPVLANSIVAQSVSEGSLLNFIVSSNTFSDADAGDSLRYSATLSNGAALPSWLTFNAGTRTFSGMPLHNNIGNVSIVVTATDNAGASVSTNMTVSVNANANPNIMYGTLNSDTLNGTNNSDTIFGAAGNDSISGGAGDNVLNGGMGDDYLTASTGNDTYQFNRGDGRDVINESGGLDMLVFGSDIAPEQLWFQRGSNTEVIVSVIGTRDVVTILRNSRNVAVSPVEQIKTANGKILALTGISALISAMANLTTPTVGQTTLPLNYQTTLNPIIAANWM